MLPMHRVPPCRGADAGEIRGHSMPFVDNDNISAKGMYWQATIRSRRQITSDDTLERRRLGPTLPLAQNHHLLISSDPQQITFDAEGHPPCLERPLATTSSPSVCGPSATTGPTRSAGRRGPRSTWWKR